MDFKRKIQKKGLKIIWIADKLNISQPLLSMYLSGNRNMPIRIEKKLRKILQ